MYHMPQHFKTLHFTHTMHFYVSFDNPKSRSLRSSGSLRSHDWQFITDASGQIISPIFKGQT
jgi:hypothetical protein